MQDINLTICLRFQNSPDRLFIQEADRTRRAAGLTPIAQTLIDLLLAARWLKGSNDRRVIAALEIDSESYGVTITPPGYSDPSVRY